MNGIAVSLQGKRYSKTVSYESYKASYRTFLLLNCKENIPFEICTFLHEKYKNNVVYMVQNNK